MHSLQSELKELRAANAMDSEMAEHALAIDRGAAFSVFLELRIVLYLAVLLIVTGVGILLANNVDRIGPVAIALTVALSAACCYAFIIRKQLKGQARSVVGDYVLLLGALLVSADVAFIETQFHLLGERWSLYLWLLAVLHAVTAYALDSRLVLSLALASLCGWFGVSQHIGNVFHLYESSWEKGCRAMMCAASVLGWRVANQYGGKYPHFNEALDHYAINLGFLAGLMWCGIDGFILLGVLVVAILAALVIRSGLITRDEWFIVYGVVYSAICVCIVTEKVIHDALVVALVILFAVIAVAVLLWRSHNQLKERAT